MSFLIFVLLATAVWLLWNISRNTEDALDKQTAIQYELASLEKKLTELSEKMSAGPNKKGAGSVKKPETPAQRSEDISVLVNINTSDLKAIVSLPRIGKALGQRIIDARPYSDVSDLKEVQGISSDMFEELKSRLTVS